MNNFNFNNFNLEKKNDTSDYIGLYMYLYSLNYIIFIQYDDYFLKEYHLCHKMPASLAKVSHTILRLNSGTSAQAVILKKKISQKNISKIKKKK